VRRSFCQRRPVPTVRPSPLSRAGSPAGWASGPFHPGMVHAFAIGWLGRIGQAARVGWAAPAERPPDWAGTSPPPNENDSASGRRHAPANRSWHRPPRVCQESFLIQLIQENQLPPIPTIHHMIYRPRIVHSQFARHSKTLPSQPQCVNS